MVGAVQGEFVLDWEGHWGALAFFVVPPHLVGIEGWVEPAIHWVEGTLTWVDLVWGAWENF